jgi:hypothetical protein
MAAIDFPNSPSVNDTFTVAGKTWIWTGVVWNIVPPNLTNFYYTKPFSSILTFDKNYIMTLDPQVGAIAFTLDATGAEVGNVNKVFIKSNGVNVPTYTAPNFIAQSVNYLNTINRWNVLYFEYSPSGKVNYWVTYE